MIVRQPQVEFEPLRVKIVMLLAYFHEFTCKIAKYLEERIGEGGGHSKETFCKLYATHYCTSTYNNAKNYILRLSMKSMIMVIRSQLHEILSPSTLLEIYSRK